MAWCPKCKNEYREGFTVCADCGCELVESLDNGKKPVYYGSQEEMQNIADFLSVNNICQPDITFNEKDATYELMIQPSEVEAVSKAMRTYFTKILADTQDANKEGSETLSEEEMKTETFNSLKSCYLDYYLGALSMELEYGEYSFEEREVYRALVDMFIKYVEEAVDNATDGIAKFDITKDILNKEMEEYYMITELANTIHCTIDFRDFATTGTYVDTYQVGESSSNVKEDMLLVCDECMMLFFDER